MAEAYTKTIEFKAKDAQIKRAVKELGRSLEGIDKSLDKINEAFSKSIRGGIKATVKEVGNISSAIKDLSKVAKGIEIVPKQKITASIQGVKRVEAVLKRLQNTSTPFGKNRRLSDDYNKAAKDLEEYISAVARGTQAISANEAGLRRQAAAFNLVASNARVTSQQFTDGVTSQLKAEEKLRLAQLERIRVQERLYATDFTEGGTKIDATGFRGIEGVLGAESQVSNTKASLTAYRSELENINRFLTIGGDQYNRVEQAINRINGRLGQNLKLQKDETTEVAKKASLLERTFSGDNVRKFGKFFENNPLLREGSRAGVGWLGSGAVEGLAKSLSFLNSKFLENTQAVAHWSRKSIEGIVTVRAAYDVFSLALGGATWVTGAIGGILRWEEQAMLSIRKINGARKSLDQRMADALDRGENPFTGIGNFLRGKTGERGKKAEIADKGTSLQEQLESDLSHQLQLLTKTNAEASEYLGIQSKAIDLQKRLNAEIDQKRTLEVEAGRAASEVFPEEYRDFQQQNKKIRDQVKARYKEEQKLRDDQRQDADKLLRDKVKDNLQAERDLEKAARDRHRKQMRREKELQNEQKRRAQQRKDAMGRFGENVMLGAGFPMLFGGGAGAVAGGLTGAVTQSVMGSRGFGAQILFSAVGQQVDAFAAKAVELGKALQDPAEAKYFK